MGLVSEMPSGPGVISEEVIAEIAATVPPPVATFLLTSQTTSAELIAQQRRCRKNNLQLCDRVDLRVYEELHETLPGVKIVQVIHVAGEQSVREALESADQVDALLLDSGNQSLPVKQLGGTGRTHDWSLSARIVSESRIPVFLAGGLNPDNVADAIAAVRPFGVDLCSGVRTDDKLDEAKLKAFMRAVQATG